jgi:site-specific recombinase XerD
LKELHLYLCSERNCQTNTANKYLRTLRAVINEALRLKLMEENPFSGVRLTEERRVIEFLTSEELNRIRALKLNSGQLELARDLFVFACFTGLSFSDVKSLNGGEIKAIGNHTMIYKYRHKTNILSRVPLQRPAKEILDKYGDHETNNNSLLPVPSNQKLNAYLKEIAFQVR